MAGAVTEAEAALGADLNHVASGRLVCAAQGIDSIYVLHFFSFLRLDYNQVITILTVGIYCPTTFRLTSTLYSEEALNTPPAFCAAVSVRVSVRDVTPSAVCLPHFTLYR